MRPPAGSRALVESLGLRWADASDNDALVHLSARCTMEADISLCIQREPDFFALCRARGEGRTLVAEADGRVVACGSVARRTGWVLGEEAPIGHVGDVKVLPEYRRLGIAQRILHEIAEAESEAPPAPYVGLTATGNTATDALVRGFGHGKVLHDMGAFTSHQLLPLCRLAVPGDVRIAPAEEADVEELVELLDRHHRRYSFSPVFGGGGLAEVLSRSPGMALQSYQVARRGGRIVATLACWEESGLKQTVVRRMTRALRLASGAFRVAGALWPVPPFPREGEELRFRYLRHLACEPGEVEALSALVRHAVNGAGEQRLHFALATIPDGDPLRACLKGIPRARYHYQLVAGTNSSSYLERLARIPSTPIYDDAALS